MTELLTNSLYAVGSMESVEVGIDGNVLSYLPQELRHSCLALKDAVDSDEGRPYLYYLGLDEGRIFVIVEVIVPAFEGEIANRGRDDVGH